MIDSARKAISWSVAVAMNETVATVQTLGSVLSAGGLIVGLEPARTPSTTTSYHPAWPSQSPLVACSRPRLVWKKSTA